MSVFCLIHGSTQSPAGWQRLIPELRQRGHDAPDVPCSSIVCADDRTISPAWSRRIARERLGVDPIELPGGTLPSCVSVCVTRRCSRILEALVSAVSSGRATPAVQTARVTVWPRLFLRYVSVALPLRVLPFPPSSPSLFTRFSSKRQPFSARVFSGNRSSTATGWERIPCSTL